MALSPNKFKCDIPNCVFVHISGFIGGNKSFEGSLAMEKVALRFG